MASKFYKSSMLRKQESLKSKNEFLDKDTYQWLLDGLNSSDLKKEGKYWVYSIYGVKASVSLDESGLRFYLSIDGNPVFKSKLIDYNAGNYRISEMVSFMKDWVKKIDKAYNGSDIMLILPPGNYQKP